MTTLKILLVQLFSNGDCLYATAVAKQIKKDYADCSLTWAISSGCKDIIAGNPFVDEVLEVKTVPKGNEAAFRKFVTEIRGSGSWDKIVITHGMGPNIANYDGCIRSALFRGYTYPLTVDTQPVLRLKEMEINNANDFAVKHGLSAYKNVLLFEFAPLSGQALLNFDQAIEIANELADTQTAVILSSATKIIHDNKSVFDGSVLTIRETAALTHYCTFLIGCSSGITWITTSDAARQLPMVQLLNPKTTMINPVSRDFKRFNIKDTELIEVMDCAPPKIISCVKMALVDFGEAKKKYHELVPLHFKSTRNIIYMLLCYLEFSAILKHIRVNHEMFGHRVSFYKNVLIGFLIFPFKLLSNFLKKRVFR